MHTECSSSAQLLSQPEERDLQWISLSYQDLYMQTLLRYWTTLKALYLQAIDGRGSNAALNLRRLSGVSLASVRDL
jgi:hypothetical protein